MLYHQGTPTDWCMENVAKLLKLCGETVCLEVLGNKAINGRVHELSYLGYYLGQVTDRCNFDVLSHSESN